MGDLILKISISVLYFCISLFALCKFSKYEQTDDRYNWRQVKILAIIVIIILYAEAIFNWIMATLK